MALKDPTAWADDISFYMTEEDLAETAAAGSLSCSTVARRPPPQRGSALVGALGGAFGAVTVSPAIRHPIAFSALFVVTALLLRGLTPSRCVCWAGPLPGSRCSPSSGLRGWVCVSW